MAVAFVAAGSASSLGSANTTGPSVGVPSGHQADDILILAIGNFRTVGAAATPDTPSGWNSLASNAYADTRLRTTFFWRRATSGSESAVTPTSATSVIWENRMYAWRGVDTGTAIDAAAVLGSVNTTANVPTPAITTATNNALIVFIGEDQIGNAWNTPPAGATERHEFNPAVVFKFVVADKTKATAGTESADVYARTLGAATDARINAFAFREASAAAAFVPRIMVI